jgi:thiamine transport system permease protein
VQRPLLAHLCGVLAALFLAVFLLYPLATILLRSGSSALAVEAVVGNPYYRERLAFTTFQALLSTLLTVVLALPSALLFARFDFPGKRLLRSLFLVPFVMPTVVAAIGFLALVGPQGVFGRALDLRGTLAVILLAHVFYNYAVVVRIVGAYLEALGRGPSEAAAMLGSPGWRTLWRVTLPLAWPAILAAATLVFIFCFTSFGVILILAPEPRFGTLEVEIYRLTARLLQLDRAALLALVQLAVVGGFTLLYTHLQARLAVPVGVGRPRRPEGMWRWLLTLHLLVAGGLILAPLAALLLRAFWSGGTLTLANFAALAEAPRSVGFAGAGRAVWNTLRFACLSLGVSLGVGAAFAYAVARGAWRWLDALSLLPLATSAVTLGFGYLLAFPQLSASFWGIVLAHSLVGFPFVVRSLLPALRGMPPSLLEAASTLGAGSWSRLRRLEVPLLAPSLVVAASFAFAVSVGEFGATLVLQRPEFATIPVAIFDRLGRPGAANYGAALALSTLLMLLTTAAMLLLERFGRGEW